MRVADQSRVSERIRSNVWAIALCFAALTGTAIAAGSGGDKPKAKSAASAIKQIKKLKQKVTALEARLGPLQALEGRIAALEGKPAPTVPTIPTSLPPSGPAGGELTGTYPAPTVGTVSGLDFAPGTAINFLPDPVLGGGAILDSGQEGLELNSGLTVGGFTSLDAETFLGSYLRLDRIAAAPPVADCNQSFETGRVVLNNADDKVYVCVDGPPIAWTTLN